MENRVIIAGDFVPKDRVANLINSGDYAAVFGEMRDVLKATDYSIVNLECPVLNHNAAPIDKHGPNLCCTKQAVESLKWAGFKCVTLANNHFLDYGIEGVNDTIEACKTEGLDFVGGGINLADAEKTHYIDINGEIVAIINCCEHEFSIATEESAGSNPLNIIKQYYAIQDAKTKASYIIVIVHGGVEHFWLPSPRMKEAYRFFIDSGADVVINHHQHCYSGYEEYRGKPIFYGLGNFCFDWNKENELWSSGYVVSLKLGDNGISFDLLPYRQCYRNDIGVRFLTQEETEQFYEKIKQYNLLISNDSLNNQEYIHWCHKTEENYKLVLNPLYNRYTKGFFESSFCKSLFKKRWFLAKDMIENESHVERLKMTINSMIK